MKADHDLEKSRQPQEIKQLFEQVYLQHFFKMKRFAQTYVLYEEEAESVVQELFVDFWEKRDLLQMHVNLVPYLYTSLKNRCIDYLRRKIVMQRVTSEIQKEHLLALKMNLASLKALDDDCFLQEEVIGAVKRAISSLPEKCREIFIKSKIEGMKQKAIAAELNISLNTVETQMGVAYKKLKTALKAYF